MSRQDRYHGAYKLTAKIASLGFTFLARSGVTDLAQPILDRLARASGNWCAWPWSMSAS